MMNKIIDFIKDKKAEEHQTYIYAIILILVFNFFGIAMSNVLTIYTQAERVKETMKEACIWVMTSNWDEVYYSLREGYAGGYLSRGNEIIDDETVYNIMMQELQTVYDSGEKKYVHLNSVINDWDFAYYDITYHINNSGFKVTNKYFNIDLTLTFEAPFRLLNFSFPVVATLKQTATWRPRF